MMKKEHITTDLGFASCLISLKFELLRLDKTNPKRVQFIFKWSKEIGEVENEYGLNQIKLPARELFDIQKMLKNRIYAE